MNHYYQAKEKFGMVIIDGVEHALLQQPYLDNHKGEAAYKAVAISEDMLDDDGCHDIGVDDSTTVVWDCSEWFKRADDEEFNCDWENDATEVVM